MINLTEAQASRILKKFLTRYNQQYFQEWQQFLSYDYWHLEKNLGSRFWTIYLISNDDSSKYMFLDKNNQILKINSTDKPTNVQLLNFLLDHKDQIIDKNYPETGILHVSDSLEKLLIEDDLEK